MHEEDAWPWMFLSYTYQLLSLPGNSKLTIEWFVSSDHATTNLLWLTCRLKIMLNTGRSVAALDKIPPEIQCYDERHSYGN